MFRTRKRGGTASVFKRRRQALSVRKRKARNHHVPRKYLFIFMLAVVIAAFTYSFYRFDRTIIPLVLDAAELTLQTDINNVINAVITDIIRDNHITATDFYSTQQNQGAGAPVLTVNTVLVNGICNLAAKLISERLNTLEPEVVRVPIGMAFHFDTLAQVGPRFSFTMAPIGNALVDFDSRFSAVGINQVHFSLWLDVEATIRIINPVHSFEVEVSRRILLVDTIISGVVPDTYLNLDLLR
jgi:sporulation protein YunB